MSVNELFRLVAQGRMARSRSHRWMCPLCFARLGGSTNRDESDRRALAHCLAHAERSLFEGGAAVSLSSASIAPEPVAATA